MTRTCGTCGRSWDGRATFCGACGELLDTALTGATTSTSGSFSSGRWRTGLVGLGVLAAMVGAAIAVPRITIERQVPVSGDIGVPDVGDLRAAPANATVRPEADPPDVWCTAGKTRVDCVRWSRSLVPPPEMQQSGTAWVFSVDDQLYVPSANHLEAVDALTGTRLWRIPLGQSTQPIGATADAMVLEGPTTTIVIDTDDGATRWSVRANTRVFGDVGWSDLLLTGTDWSLDERGLAARDARTGEVRWSWPSQAADLSVRQLPDARLLVQAPELSELAVLDAATGRQLHHVEIDDNGWLLDVVDDVAVTVVPRRGDPGGPRPAGDPGARLVAIDLRTGDIAWNRRVPASEVSFGVVDGQVLAPSTDRLTAIAAETGEVTWQVATDGQEAVAHHGPVGFAPRRPTTPTPMLVTVTQADGTIRGRDPTNGREVWQLDGPDPLHAVASGDGVLAFGPDGITLIDPATGDDQLLVHAAESTVVASDPLVLHDYPSGWVTRIEPDAAPVP